LQKNHSNEDQATMTMRTTSMLPLSNSTLIQIRQQLCMRTQNRSWQIFLSVSLFKLEKLLEMCGENVEAKYFNMYPVKFKKINR